MKNINLPALGQVTLDDIGSFISWLERCPSGEMSLDQIKKNPPVRGSKINPAVKLIEFFAFANNRQNRIHITSAGKDFARSSMSVRKAVIKTLFMKVEQVQGVVELLKTSSTGRLHRSVVNDSFNLSSVSQVAESEILGFIAWAQACDLFFYDRKLDEIFDSSSGVPRDPKVNVPSRGEVPATLRLVS